MLVVVSGPVHQNNHVNFSSAWFIFRFGRQSNPVPSATKTNALTTVLSIEGQYQMFNNV